MNKLLSLVIILAMGLSPAYAKKTKENWFKALNLSANQKKQIVDLRKGYLKRTRVQKSALKKAQKELKMALESNKPSKELQTRFSKVSKLRSLLARERFNNVIAIRSLLTPQQRKVYKSRR